MNDSLHRVMEQDERVYCIGEDILDPYGGAFKVTKGLSTRFPGRVLTTPISEAAIVGAACGMSMRGLRPVAELMFGDFVALAMDQLINHVARFKWMYNEQVDVPVVIRTPMGGGRGYGPTHSQNLEKHLLGIPGLVVVAPHHLLNPGELLEQAVADDDPVVFIEDKAGYSRHLAGALPEMQTSEIKDRACAYPTLLARHTEGSDGAVFCYGAMALKCLEAVEILRRQQGLLLSLIVFTRISPLPETHVAQILRQLAAGPCFYCEEASPDAGFGAEAMACVNRTNLSQVQPLALSHHTIGARHEPIAGSRELEENTLPQVRGIVERILNEY